MTKPYVENAADENQVKSAAKKERIEEIRRLDDVREVLSTRGGRRFLWRYLGLCHMYSSSFTGDPITTAFKEGERNVGLKIQADINEADPEKILLMMKEGQEYE